MARKSAKIALTTAGFLIAFAPVTAAHTNVVAQGNSTGAGQAVGTDPLIPYGTEPTSPVRLGYIDSNHDEVNTSGGGVDTPF